MDKILKCFVLICSILHCKGHSFRKLWDDSMESKDIFYGTDRKPSRRFDLNHVGSILGAPSIPSHLPQAEPILPGHTLIRPSIDMLKSAVKFPHRDPDNGAGVYGNLDNLGLRYDGTNERIVYTGFRRADNVDRRGALIDKILKKLIQLKEQRGFE